MYEEEEIDKVIKARISPFDIPNYRDCPEEYILKLKELRYSERTIKTYKGLFEEFINLNKYNLNNNDFLNINIKNVYLDNIHWNKINYNQNNLGYSLNLNDLCYKNYEININEDKRFYYI